MTFNLQDIRGWLRRVLRIASRVQSYPQRRSAGIRHLQGIKLVAVQVFYLRFITALGLFREAGRCRPRA
ncbi:hypothetical protein AWI11_25380 [Enterobacter hormaechei subsp. steigerwaltii]|nr:hypothetical protein AWI11_25380 [Enterobacter hormaechei subsp. steigerwaltii]